MLIDVVVFLVWNKDTRSSKTSVQLQVLTIYLRLKLYLKTLLGLQIPEIGLAEKLKLHQGWMTM